mmetsp:Transcript_13722/g.29836  ORF Transcript_13722/g.29836 Transcript_13722/m.29836 type:complete len:563 (+) Transcript_13722:150-1838(+)
MLENSAFMKKIGISLPLSLFALSGVIHLSTSCVAFGFCSQWQWSGHFDQQRQLPSLHRCTNHIGLSRAVRQIAATATESSLLISCQDVSVQDNTPSGIGDDNEEISQQARTEAKTISSPLGFNLQSLSNELKGSGRAAVVWDCLRTGIDPNLYYSTPYKKDVSDHPIAQAWIAASSPSTSSSNLDISSLWQDEGILGRRQGQGLGTAAWKKLQNVMHNYFCYNNGLMQIGNSDVELQQDREAIYTIENTIASLSQMKVSPDGTTKLLLKMKNDGLEVESVIIPWMDKGFSTLCVSSQVGCKQGCTFCATGRMGKLRSLTTDEILVQFYYASKVCRVISNLFNAQSGDNCIADHYVLPKVDNVVFMGMGEPADNVDAVVPAVNALVDPRMFGLAQSKVTISTVAPDPLAFAKLGQAPAALAWSVHAVDDSLRRRLVPTTRHSMEELKKGLVQALSSRSNKLRRIMLEVALIEGVNDSDEDAERLATFSQSIMNEVAGSKVVANLIPYNAIDNAIYRTPSVERVLRFQKIVTDCGVLCYVRTTRGDDESAACGQLATKKKRVIE